MAPRGCAFPCSCVFKVNFKYWFNPLTTNASVRNQSIDLQITELTDWFLYDRNIHHNWDQAIFPALNQRSAYLVNLCDTTYLSLLLLVCYYVPAITPTLVLIRTCHYYRSCATRYLPLIPLFCYSEPAISTSLFCYSEPALTTINAARDKTMTWEYPFIRNCCLKWQKLDHSNRLSKWEGIANMPVLTC